MYASTFEFVMQILIVAFFTCIVLSMATHNDEDVSLFFGIGALVFFIAAVLVFCFTPSKYVMLESEYYAMQNELRPNCIKQLNTINIDSLPASCVEEYIEFKADSTHVDTLYHKYRERNLKKLSK